MNVQDEWGIELTTTDGLMSIKHAKEAVARVHAMVEALDEAALTALQCATMESKSIVLSMALVLQRITPEQVEPSARVLKRRPGNFHPPSATNHPPSATSILVLPGDGDVETGGGVPNGAVGASRGRPRPRSRRSTGP